MMTEGSDRCRIGRHGAAGLILLDTCESGALTDGYTCARIEGPASEVAIGHLHEAAGRPVLSAAAAGQYAREGRVAGSGQFRGIFTWAVLNALKNSDGDQDGSIQISEIVAHVQDVVHSLAHGLARAVSQTEPVFGVQTPRLFLAGKFPTAENTAISPLTAGRATGEKRLEADVANCDCRRDLTDRTSLDH